jgi:hypothetical protein
MRAILLLVFVATIGFALPACGSGKKSVPSSFAGPVTTTFANATTGEPIRCKSSYGVDVGAVVPPPGKGVSGTGDGPSGGATIQLTRGRDGSLIVSCTP